MSAVAELINQLCPNGVEYKTLGETCARHHGTMITAGRMSQLSTDDGDVRVFAAGSTVANIPSAEIPANDVIREPGVIVKSRGYIGFEFCDCPFTHKNELWSYTVKDNGVDLKFVYYYLQTRVGTLQKLARSKSVKLPQLATGDTDKLEIPVPSLPVQQEIVRRLDAMTGLIEDLEKELAARQKQYEWVREETFKQLEAEGVERKKLGEIASDVYRGNGILRTQVTDSGVECVRYGEIYTEYNVWFENCVSHTQLKYVASPKSFGHGDLLFAITGEKVEEIGKCVAYVGTETSLAGGDIVVMKHSQDAKYLAYALSTHDAQAQKSRGKVKSKVVHSSVPELKKVSVPVPSLPVQQKIVRRLDEMTELIVGIEKEIALRKQQYEYCRDQLMNFKKAEVAA